MSDWLTADEWFTDFINNLEANTRRRARLWREHVTIPARDQIQRDNEQKTEHLRRMIHVERERWLTEQRTA